MVSVPAHKPQVNCIPVDIAFASCCSVTPGSVPGSQQMWQWKSSDRSAPRKTPKSALHAKGRIWMPHCRKMDWTHSTNSNTCVHNASSKGDSCSGQGSQACFDDKRKIPPRYPIKMPFTGLIWSHIPLQTYIQSQSLPTPTPPKKGCWSDLMGK